MSKLRSESYIIAKKTNIKPELVDYAIDHFEDQLRRFLSNPEECPGGILIPGLCSFKINPFAEERKINMILNGRYKKNHYIGHRRQELLKLIKENARQVKKKNDNAGHDEGTVR